MGCLESKTFFTKIKTTKIRLFIMYILIKRYIARDRYCLKSVIVVLKKKKFWERKKNRERETDRQRETERERESKR